MFRARSAPMIALSALAVVQPAAPALAALISSRIYPAANTPLSLKNLPDAVAINHVRTSDGLTLKGLEAAPHLGRPVLLVFHDNRGDASQVMHWLAPLVEQGFGLVAAEYRGYGANAGSPSEAGLALDADAYLLRAQALAGTSPVMVMGHGLGAGVAISLAQRAEIDALITIGAFSRLETMVPKFARSFLTDRFDNLKAIDRINAPWFLIHGMRDRMVSPDEGRKLHEAAVRKGRDGASIILTDADHQPEAELLSATFGAIETHLMRGKLPDDLPSEIGVFPFSAR